MFEEKNCIYVDDHEKNAIMFALVDLRNKLIAEGKYTDLVDDTILAVHNSKRKRLKI